MATLTGFPLRRLIGFVAALLTLLTFRPAFSQAPAENGDSELNRLMETYWEDFLLLHPIRATFIGDNRYNDRLPVEISRAHRDKQSAFYSRYLKALHEIDRTRLSDANRINYDLLKLDPLH